MSTTAPTSGVPLGESGHGTAFLSALDADRSSTARRSQTRSRAVRAARPDDAGRPTVLATKEEGSPVERSVHLLRATPTDAPRSCS